MLRPAPALLALLLSGVPSVRALPPAPAPDSALLGGLRSFKNAFTPVSGETSLLAYAAREHLDWTAFQNLFSLQVTDTRAGYLDWRGHSATTAGSVFTTLRAATYRAGARTLLVVNREWCASGSCQTRTAFSWLDGSTLKPVKDATVIPLIRDTDFYLGPVPACLRGVTLNVSYLPSRQGGTLSAVAVAPRAAQQACLLSGLLPEAVTRPLTLHWTSSAGKFRRGW
ncbi:hypothetical protein E7T09_01245 [Deinococcus sp. KSM4-11]|uniref:hypothetical protein n=1 Tax=Deinococcus sp. KSM4-11 TaxID=2568654 RepID=UPI0010A53DA8|nr:hypothetical protein [Deinococcus sp. KSM4-11]THF87886.1 hypothetical protein E7T09_01245 [Deinococcus sp. KSM4-11]